MIFLRRTLILLIRSPKFPNFYYSLSWVQQGYNKHTNSICVKNIPDFNVYFLYGILRVIFIPDFNIII
jgi:hypothetical protein